MSQIENLLESWDGEQVLMGYDVPTKTWIFICMHSTRLGPAGGGTRMKVYPNPEEALSDGLRLSTAMTRKLAIADLPFGGGKSVLAVPALPDLEERRRIITRFAEMIATLNGNMRVGPDMNTSEFDMDLVWDIVPYSFGRGPERGGSGSSAPDTAVGVYHGIKATVDSAFGSPRLKGRTVVVQGIGAVGKPLIELLVNDGADVLVTDVSDDRVREVVEEFDVREVQGDVYETECDVFSPCAIGAILNPDTIPRLRCRIVAGAANNQLARDHDAELLKEAGILYAPDYVINSGGALHLVGLESLGWTRAELDARLVRLGEVLKQIYRTADAQGISTEAAASRIAEERLAQAGPASSSRTATTRS